MSVTPFVIALLGAIALGQSLLCAAVLAPQARAGIGAVYLPLALFFLANAITELVPLVTLPIFFDAAPYSLGLFGFFAIPVNCLLAPLFWIYVRGLTAEHPNVWSNQDHWHFLLAAISLALPIVAWLMPSSDLIALFQHSGENEPNSVIQSALVMAVNGIDVVIILQVGFYIALIIRRLRSYRTKLTQLFASTEHLELRWFRWLALLMFTYLMLSILSTVTDMLSRSPYYSLAVWEALVDVGLIATLAIWGLRQKPGLSIESAAITADNKHTKKYQHSALSSQQCKVLAEKIQHAVVVEKLYQQDDLSLRILAKHIGELPQYVTQALNTIIGESFFDYINRWRIEEAARRLSESRKTVLDIANDVGFNSRSSFYTAFKKYMGVTPTTYRKNQG